MSKRHIYKGINFRSLLEWDWARYLDWERIPWSYEPRTFSNKSGRYTPDFQVGNLPIYFEAKGSLLHLNRHIDACTYPLIFALGSPKDGQVLLFLNGKPTARYTDWQTAYDQARQELDTMTNGTPTAPMTPIEAEHRFFAKYGENTGTTWAAVQGFLGKPTPKPTTVQGWIALADQVRDQVADLAYAEDQLFPDKNQAPAPTGGNDMARIATALEGIAAALHKLAEQPVARPMVQSKPKVDIPFGPDGVPVCPKHNRRMRESDFGGWFCTAKDDEGKNGRCGFKVKE